MDIAVAAIDDIAHDSRKRRTIEPVTIDASPHIGERFQSGRMRHLDFIAIGSAQQRPRRLRHADLVKRKHPLALDLKLKWTPFHFVSEERWISFSPWILVGLYAVGADFSVDAGPPQGVTTYETDPYPYVIGGRGEGQVGALLPEIGVGGEFRFGLWEMNGDRAELALQIEYAFMDVAANTGDFGINSRNEKNIDTAFHNLDLRAQFELPLNENLDLLFGAGLKRIEVDATIEADRTPPDQRTTEKYDKTAELQMDYIYLFGGLKF